MAQVLPGEMLSEHAEARAAWDAKPVLRTVYRHLFDTIFAETVPGSILEIGGGSGRMKEHRPDIISSDLHSSDVVDLSADAMDLPFDDGSLQNIVMLDVLHHVPVPKRALKEFERVLARGGRLIMLEPGITPGSYLFYKLFHPEPVDLTVDPLEETPLSSTVAYDSNQAIPTLLVGRARERLREVVPRLSLRKTRWMSFVAYPLSGGLRHWSLIPKRAIEPLLKLEDRLPNFIGRLAGFRVLIVMERI